MLQLLVSSEAGLAVGLAESRSLPNEFFYSEQKTSATPSPLIIPPIKKKKSVWEENAIEMKLASFGQRITVSSL